MFSQFTKQIGILFVLMWCLKSFAGSLPRTTVTYIRTARVGVVTEGSPPFLSQLEIILFGVGGFVIIVICICALCCFARVKKRRGTIKLPDAKYDVATERVAIEPQSFAPRTASVSSTGSAALFMRQRSMRGRLESRLTQVRI